MPPPKRVIDFASDRPSSLYTPTESLRCSTVHVTRGVMRENPGSDLATAQLVLAVHESASWDVTWRPPGGTHTRRVRMGAGDVLICPANRPVFLSWSGKPTLLVVAFMERLVDRVGEHFGGRRGGDIATIVGARDMELEAVARSLRRELREGGASGSLYIESLGTIALVRLFRAYLRGAQPSDVKGGLGVHRFQRVVDHVEAHLGEAISLEELAGVAKLSAHHFSEAFRASAGVTPHRYVLRRRIERACEMLESSDASITAIAAALGFASHGHLTTQFRKLTGTTPSKFRSARGLPGRRGGR